MATASVPHLAPDRHAGTECAAVLQAQAVFLYDEPCFFQPQLSILMSALTKGFAAEGYFIYPSSSPSFSRRADQPLPSGLNQHADTDTL